MCVYVCVGGVLLGLARDSQVRFERQLLADVRAFVLDVEAFRADYLANGPTVRPRTAMPVRACGRRYIRMCPRGAACRCPASRPRSPWSA